MCLWPLALYPSYTNENIHFPSKYVHFFIFVLLSLGVTVVWLHTLKNRPEREFVKYGGEISDAHYQKPRLQ